MFVVTEVSKVYPADAWGDDLNVFDYNCEPIAICDSFNQASNFVDGYMQLKGYVEDYTIGESPTLTVFIKRVYDPYANTDSFKKLMIQYPSYRIEEDEI